MTHRERVLTAFRRRKPDRAPRSAHLVDAAAANLLAAYGIEDPAAHFDFDLKRVAFRPPDPLPDYAERFGKYFSDVECEIEFRFGREYPAEWGVAQQPAHLYHFARPISPLRNAEAISEIEDYPMPDYLGQWSHDHLESEVARLHDEGWAVVGHVGWIFQQSWFLRSREKLFVDFYENAALAERLISRVADVKVAMAERFAAAGVDIIGHADDIGMQDRMIMSPRHWRRFIKPHTARMIAAARRVKGDILLTYHTDGFIEPVIEDLIEIGVDVLTTVQPECMDPFEIKRRFGDRISLAGTIGVQSTLRWASADEVRRTVRRHLQEIGRDGGFMLSPANAIEPDVPPENVVAMFDAADDCGG